MASEAEIKRRIALLREEAEINRGIFERDKRRTKALKESRAAIEQILRLEAQLTNEYQDIDKTLADIVKKQSLSKNSTKDTFGLQRNIRKETKEQLEDVQGLLKSGQIQKSTSEKLNSIGQKLVDGSMSLKDIKSEQYDLDQLIAAEEDETAKNNLRGFKDTLSAEEDRLTISNALNAAASEFDGIIGGIGGKLKGMLLNPLTAATAILLTFNATQESIGNQFGAIGVKEFRGELGRANAQFTSLGLSAEESQSTISNLANEFGLSVDESAALSENVSRLAVSTGATLEDTTTLVGLFTQTQNLTGEQAANLLASTTALANANNVAPDKVLADVAQSTEFFAKFADDGGQNILKAAVQARKLGINLQSVEKITTGLLDFQTSLNAEQEASVIIGRRLNFQKARELALANDVTGATAEVVKQLGTAEEFNRLNAIERQKLADAAGLEVNELQKIVNKEKEALTLQGALSKQEIKPIPEEVLTATASLIANLQSIGIVIAETLGPPLNLIVGVFGTLLSAINNTVGVLPALIGLLVTFKGQALLAAAANAKVAIATFFKNASIASLTTGGLGLPGFLSIAAGATAALLTALATAPRFQSIQGTTDVANIKGGIAIADANESIVDTGALNAAINNNGTSREQIRAIEKQTETQNRTLAILEGAFGDGGRGLAKMLAGGVVSGNEQSA